jgi:hypothetical protein
MGGVGGDGERCEDGNVFNINLAITTPLQGMKMEKREDPIVKLKEQEKEEREEKDFEKYEVIGKMEKKYNNLRNNNVRNNNSNNNNNNNNNECFLLMEEESPDKFISFVKSSFMDPVVTNGGGTENSVHSLLPSQSPSEYERIFNEGKNEENGEGAKK